MIVDELNHRGSRASSSRPKNDEAAYEMSFVRFSALTSGSNGLIR